MYFTANGRALPCCIAPFSQRGYENYTLGDATQQTLREIWTGPAYSDFRKALLSDKPPDGLRELRIAVEPLSDAAAARRGVAVVIPTFNEAESIAAVVAEMPRDVVDRVIVVDGGSSDGTPDEARARRRRSDRGRPRLRAGLPGRRASGGHCRHHRLHGRRRRRRSGRHRGDGRADPRRRHTTSSSPRARAASASRAAWRAHQILAGLHRRLADRASLRRALHRYVRFSRHPPRHVARRSACAS